MKRSLCGFSAIVLIAGTVLSACSTPDKKDDAGKSITASDTTAATAAQPAIAKTKLDKGKVPKKVTEIFYTDYPAGVVNDDRWYGYPTVDYANDWYDYDPDVYVNDNPDTYVVEFTSDSIPHKTLYTKAGKKIAVHKAISVLPSAVSKAISNGKYKTWTTGKEIEEIFKDKDSDKLKIYKVSVSMGDQKHILYFESSGKLVKDKKMS